jgi:predicted RNA-binding Zn ribbon-like protein
VIPNEEKIKSLSLVGGALCLDFTNLVSWRDSPAPRDYMQSYDDLVLWSAHAGLLTVDEQRELLESSKGSPEAGALVFAEALDLREAIFRIFSAAAEASEPVSRDVDSLNHFLSRAMAAARVEKGQKGFGLGFSARGLDRMLPPIVWSAVQLLTGESLRRVKGCSGDNCGWLFVDMSKNGSRKWCEMRDCGNRAKARRHYQKVRNKGPAEGKAKRA